ncbi:type II toxin-antitoxin system death-on-curing family toxin [Rhizobium alvei]|uniref:Type II toxin-antitoxin system death-on-curing family toxin n=1 Tax=Rhizobium alvei TaxID=1132659 RepID=A0ABT8YJ80_9HYPH|nr:type II toxin-antitoxin system death-on-curing family toxin [Rhizobium alvei]MDO6963754.1 type II toxin-antitoxin system death-on-curing family toxin [Rhizobium alvei]
MSIEFIHQELIVTLHRMQIEHFGGSYGLRDEGALQSAIGRPLNKAAYGEKDVIVLASAYLFGLAKNHPFIDGNKRIAIVTAGVFLELNGLSLNTSDVNLYNFVMGIAAGEIDEEGATRFIRDFTVPL